MIRLIYHPLKVCKMDGRFFFIYGKERCKFYLPPLWCNKYQVRQNFIPREEVHSFDVVSCHPWCKMVFYLFTTVLAPSVTQLRIFSDDAMMAYIVLELIENFMTKALMAETWKDLLLIEYSLWLRCCTHWHET